jgi:hypothetical protein
MLSSFLAWAYKWLPFTRARYVVIVHFHREKDASKFMRNMSWDKVCLYPAPEMRKEIHYGKLE